MSTRKKEGSDTPSAAPEEAVAAPSAEEVREESAEAAEPSLEEQLAACREEAARNRDHYLRAMADLENYRKRVQKEKDDLARFGNESLLREILPVADNLGRALDHARQEGGGNEGLLQGVELTLSQMQRILEKFNVTAVSALGEPFDPAWHEAMGQVETAEHPPNTVVQELQKGYKLNDRLLRPALVMVARAPAG